MNPARKVLNVLLAVAAAGGGVALLTMERWAWATGSSDLVFTGTALRLLSAGLLLLAAFAAAIARAWHRGEIEMPPSDEAIPHPAYRGRLLLRYWYLVGPALACFVAAFWLAR